MKNLLEILQYNQNLLKTNKSLTKPIVNFHHFFDGKLNLFNPEILVENFLTINLFLSLTRLKIDKYEEYINSFADIVKSKKQNIYKKLFDNKEILKHIGNILNELYKSNQIFYINFYQIKDPYRILVDPIENNLLKYYNEITTIDSAYINEFYLKLSLLKPNNYIALFPIFIISKSNKIYLLESKFLVPERKADHESLNFITTEKVIDLFLKQAKQLADSPKENSSSNTELQISNLSSINRNSLLEANNKKLELLKNKRKQSLELLEKNIDAQILAIENRSKLISLKYDDYLQSTHWLDIRKAMLRKHGNTCQKCKRKYLEHHLNIHHLHYSSIGEERLSDLLLLCRECHEKESSVFNLE